MHLEGKEVADNMFTSMSSFHVCPSQRIPRAKTQTDSHGIFIKDSTLQEAVKVRKSGNKEELLGLFECKYYVEQQPMRTFHKHGRLLIHGFANQECKNRLALASL